MCALTSLTFRIRTARPKICESGIWRSSSPISHGLPGPIACYPVVAIPALARSPRSSRAVVHVHDQGDNAGAELRVIMEEKRVSANTPLGPGKRGGVSLESGGSSRFKYD